MKVTVGDIVQMEDVREAFRDVDCVIHCAAMVSYQFPPDQESLDRVNVTGQIITQTGLLSSLCFIPLANYA
jgi:nucleoside-diphosphate-sugar epimerase